MGLELFNKTSRVKELPKYNYNGKFKLGPNMTYPIKDYMIPFYKPFERVGVIVRRSASVAEPVEPEVQKILSENVVEDEKPEVVQDLKETVVEEPSDTVAEVVEEVKVESSTEVPQEETTQESDKKIYTEEELREIKIEDMKVILDGYGVDYKSFPNKRATFVEAILNAQK